MHVQLVLPHQLFEEHLEAPEGTLFVFLEDDLLFRSLRFHQQKLVLHRAAMTIFAGRIGAAGYGVRYVETSAETPSQEQLLAVLVECEATAVSYFDVVDDWLDRRLTRTLAAAGVETSVLETPQFITPQEVVATYFASHNWRMQTFYEWQRKRLGIMVEPDGSPEGGRWSFDTENRKKLPKRIVLPDLPQFERLPEVEDAIDWVRREFPDNPGNAGSFNWPVTHRQAFDALEAFLAERFELFGPYEDSIAVGQTWLFHSALSSSMNSGLLNPTEVVDLALDFAGRHGTPIASVEGFIRQVIGWREYIRASYVLRGREMRVGNTLGFTADLDERWWTGDTGLEPVDSVITRILDTAYAHHIERLMILGNAALLMRARPDAVYEWFMEMFIDAYDWVMVPNVYAMSQYAAGTMITTKPYVSGSNYIRKMSDFGEGPWRFSWDALYWEFVADHRELFARNPRSRMSVNLLDRMDPERRTSLRGEAARWIPGRGSGSAAGNGGAGAGNDAGPEPARTPTKARAPLEEEPSPGERSAVERRMVEAKPMTEATLPGL
ncbi:cryptochrome/photolyase family protein [Arthrobacter agilis]|uniref:cryptochrome/photolyase family protein n=1 Tax=Arthrobacter agilis TaxID=37921 RepID=UPI000B35B0BE|nr:cryptochrome/photolyase family protein [Arthrobacter agilis]OUM42175.1 cryptochrome/photolyase family protein [Arthrobacter agilis]PPB45520.1 cryptochrome/photolyase family protein [Arthrobacter agilis]TPV26503.1 cryptochrome/photolyase family protein [Arthrobacter agilis]VDR33584.1 Deoxyribodipyrimidine photo-lyase-related protein [Arthrobacter agilis]